MSDTKHAANNWLIGNSRDFRDIRDSRNTLGVLVILNIKMYCIYIDIKKYNRYSTILGKYLLY